MRGSGDLPVWDSSDGVEASSSTVGLLWRALLLICQWPVLIFLFRVFVSGFRILNHAFSF